MSTVSVAIEWRSDKPEGRIEVIHGEFGGGKTVAGKGQWKGDCFAFSTKGGCRIQVKVRNACVAHGANQTRITVHAGERSFTFFLRDVTSISPMLIAMYGVVVLPAHDRRSYEEVSDAVRAMGMQTLQQQIDQEPEETYENACAGNRVEPCPTWLGLSRDMRFFEVHHNQAAGYWGYVQPRHHSVLPGTPETKDQSYSFQFAIGAGAACRHELVRRLEEGYLPILRSIQRENDISYNVTAFATLEKSRLTAKNLRGTEWEGAYPHTGGNMLTAEQKEKIKDVIDKEKTGREEETVLRVRIEAVNSGRVPRYAWFKAPSVQIADWRITINQRYDGETGYATVESDRVFSIAYLNGRPAPQQEMAVLVPAGERVVYDLIIPHQPLPAARAAAVAACDFDMLLDDCREFWHSKLRAGASISVPEAAVDERIKAGLLHCDMVALGREPDGPVLATIGWYAPIGSESAPIIQLFDGMGWAKLAERSLDFFLVRQREDGFIQNFGGYQLETGPALWTMGEHFRMTRDTKWVRRIKPKLLKACEFLLAWRERNKKSELRGKGYGLLDGKVADPEDFFHSFMLNGLSYVGIQRVAEMLREVDPAQSKRLEREAREYRADIRAAFYESVARSPVIPLGDGSWIATVPAWSEYAGPLALYADGGNWHTHRAFGARDSLIGSLYLVMGEVLDANEVGTDILVKSHQQLFTIRNGGLSQPYYVRHDFAHLIRGEVKAFLKTFYNQFTALQDRETYTFWEHYDHHSQHKTHEEGWFLMQIRWMLWLEQGDTLKLLAGVPRRWMENGAEIALNGVASYFGTLDLKVVSRVDSNEIEASIVMRDKKRLPESIVIRLPHPDGRKALRAEGGTYDSATETVTITGFTGKARVRVLFS